MTPEKAIRELPPLKRIPEDQGIKTGNVIGIMHLIEGCDPKHVDTVPDLAH